MGYIEKRGKNSWRLCAETIVAGFPQPVRITLRMDPSLSESIQRRDAERELEKLEKRLAADPETDPTLREWSAAWLKKYISQDDSAVTVSNYRHLLDSRILPALGDYRLSELTPAVLTDWLYNLRNDKRKTTRKEDAALSRPRSDAEAKKLATKAKLEKPLSTKTVVNYYGCMKTMLATAVRLGFLEYNPMDRVLRPKQRKKKVMSLSESDAITLLQLILTEAPPPLRLAVLLALLCGLRLGEVAALQYYDVDEKAGTISISKALKYTPEKGSYIDVPKTESGERLITLPPAMIQILHDALWYDVMLEQMDAENEKTWLGDRWIVHSRHGARVNKDTPSKWFRDFADAHGYRSIRFHDLRHIHASLLVANHIDIAAVAARMGHSDPSVTLNVYTHPTSPADQDAAQALDRLLRAALGQDEGATV